MINYNSICLHFQCSASVKGIDLSWKNKLIIVAIVSEFPDLNSVLNVLHNEHQTTPNWYLYGLALEIPRAILDQLKAQDYSEEDRLIETLDYWLRHHHSQPTWEEVIKAKKKVEFHELARKALL